jgi:hypothetical protein
MVMMPSDEMTTWIEISSVVDGMVMVEEIEDLVEEVA